MRTVAPVFVVLCIGTAAMMLGMAGFGDAWGAPAPQSDLAQDQVNESAASNNPNEEAVKGPVSSGESEVVGLIANGIGTLTSLAGAVVQLPATLMSLGFPFWFAEPIGRLAQIIAVVGIVEWGSNREWT